MTLADLLGREVERKGGGDAQDQAELRYAISDRATAIVSFLRQVKVTLMEARQTLEMQGAEWDAWELCKRSEAELEPLIRDLAAALGVKEESDGS